MGYSHELNKLIKELIDEEAPFYHDGDQHYRRHELASAVLNRLKDEHPDDYAEFLPNCEMETILLKVNRRLQSPKTRLATTKEAGDEQGEYQLRLNLNIPIPGQREGAMKPIFECTLREVMLDSMKREEKVQADQAVLSEERKVIRYMVDQGASMDDFVRDYFRQAA